MAKGKNNQKTVARSASNTSTNKNETKRSKTRVVDKDQPKYSSSGSSSSEEDLNTSQASRPLSNTGSNKRHKGTGKDDMDIEYTISASSTKTIDRSNINAQPAQQTTVDQSAVNLIPIEVSETLPDTPNPATNNVAPETSNKEIGTQISNTSIHASHSATTTDDMNMPSNENYAAIAANNTYFKAASPIIDIIKEKETKKQCFARITDYCIDRYDSFYRVTRSGNNSDGIIIITVKDKEDHLAILNQSHDDLVIAPEKESPTFFNYDPKAILADQKLRSITVRDIPLFFTQDTITSRFKKFGIIQKIKLHTPHNAIYQIAHITYADQKAIETIGTQRWSIFLQGECIRIYPDTLTKEECSARNQYSVILRNLPSNTKAIDLASIYSETNAAAVNLPRHTKSYQTKPWAYLHFKTEEAMQAAMEMSCSFNDRILEWIPITKAKDLCIRCSSLSHKSQNCDATQSRGRSPTKKDVLSLYSRHNIKNSYTLNKDNKRSRSHPRNHSSSRSRSRSNSRSQSKSTQTNTSSSSTSANNKKQVTYADEQDASINASIHNPAHRQRSTSSSRRNKPDNTHQVITPNTNLNTLTPQNQDTIKQVQILLNDTVKQFSTLQLEFADWKSQISTINDRISRIEEHCNINYNKAPISSSSSTSQQARRYPQSRPSYPPSSNTNNTSPPTPDVTNVNSNRIEQFEGKLSVMNQQLHNITGVLNQLLSPPAGLPQPHTSSPPK
jgi:hypothetical protein